MTTYQFFPTPGRYYVVVQAYDAGRNLSPKSAEVMFDVVGNLAPSLTQPANQTSVRSRPATLTLSGSDPENAALTYTASGLPAGLAINSSTGLISGTPTTVAVYTVTATVSDGSLTASRTFTWTITANQPPTLQQPANQTTARNTAASLTLIGSDPEGSAVTYSAAGLPPGMSVNSASGVVSGTPTTADTYAVTATVSDGTLTASRNFTWTITAPNQAPTLQQPADQVTTLNAAATLTLAGSDPEGAALSYSATGLPPGLSINGTSGVISGTASTAGAYSVTATVSDGSLTASRTFTWTVGSTTSVTVSLTPTDSTLNLNDTNYSTDQMLYAYTWPANSIANAIVMKFNLSSIPANATINSAALRLSLVDVDGATTDPIYTMTLHQIINRNPDLTRVTGRRYDGVNAWTASACCYSGIPLAQSDISPARASLGVDRVLGQKTWDALTIVRSWQSAPSLNYGLLLNSDATKPVDRWRYFASMENTNVAQRPVLVINYTVAGGPTNQAPTLSQPANQATVQTRPATLTLSGSDPEGAALTYSATGLPAGLAINASTGVIAGTPTTAAVYNVTATVSDGSLTASRSFTWTITANQAPTLAQPANQSTVRNTAASLTLSGSDPEGAAVAYGASGLPAGITINTASGVMSGTPTTVGTYTVTASVTDGYLTSTRTFTWTVTAPNQAPTLQQPANQSTVRNTAASLTLVGSDPEGAALSYSATGLPAGLSVNGVSGIVSGTPTTVGTYTVTASVSDGSLTANRTFTWTVTSPTNQPPTLAQPANQSTAQNASASLALVGSDPEGAALTYSATGLPNGLAINAASGVISGTATSAGSFAVTASVSDGALNASRTFTWTVTASGPTKVTVNLSPNDTTLNLNDRNYASEQGLYTYTWPTRKIANAIVMKFDLSQIPADATIDSATLQLSLIESDGTTSDPTYTVTLHQLINKNPNVARATGRTFDGVSAWTASNCCNQGIPMAQGDISPARASLAVDRVLGAKTWNAVDIVRSWMASPASNFGLLLNSDASKPADRYRYFASMEYPTVSARPFLRVTYTTTAAAPATQQVASSQTAMTAGGSTGGDSIDQFLAQNAEAGDQQLRGDFDGDGVVDPATFRAATGEWRLWLSSRNFAASAPIVWGTVNDLQVAADYDGDRKTDIAVYRPSTGMWHVLLSHTNNLETMDVRWGSAQDRPLAFDADNDGRADLALPQADGSYKVLLSTANYLTSVVVR